MTLSQLLRKDVKVDMHPNKIGQCVRKINLFTVLDLIVDMAGKEGHCDAKRKLSASNIPLMH